MVHNGFRILGKSQAYDLKAHTNSAEDPDFLTCPFLVMHNQPTLRCFLGLGWAVRLKFKIWSSMMRPLASSENKTPSFK